MTNCSDASYEATIACTNTTVSGNNIITAIVIDAILGLLCW